MIDPSERTELDSDAVPEIDVGGVVAARNCAFELGESATTLSLPPGGAEHRK